MTVMIYTHDGHIKVLHNIVNITCGTNNIGDYVVFYKAGNVLEAMHYKIDFIRFEVL